MIISQSGNTSSDNIIGDPSNGASGWHYDYYLRARACVFRARRDRAGLSEDIYSEGGLTGGLQNLVFGTGMAWTRKTTDWADNCLLSDKGDNQCP